MNIIYSVGFTLSNNTIRICPGRFLADASLFVTVSTILAVFNLSKAVDANGNVITPAFEYTSGTLRSVQFVLDISIAADRTSRFSHPVPFKCMITARSRKAEALILNSHK